MLITTLFSFAVSAGDSTIQPMRDLSDLELCKIVALGTADRGLLYYDDSGQRLAADEIARRAVECSLHAEVIDVDRGAIRKADEAHHAFHSNPMPPPPSHGVSCDQARDGVTRCKVHREDGSGAVEYVFQCSTDPTVVSSCRSIYAESAESGDR